MCKYEYWKFNRNEDKELMCLAYYGEYCNGRKDCPKRVEEVKEGEKNE